MRYIDFDGVILDTEDHLFYDWYKIPNYHKLTEEDIQLADYIIVAADTNVETERFRGKKVLEASVTDAIRNVKKIFDAIENGEVDIY